MHLHMQRWIFYNKDILLCLMCIVFSEYEKMFFKKRVG